MELCIKPTPHRHYFFDNEHSVRNEFDIKCLYPGKLLPIHINGHVASVWMYFSYTYIFSVFFLMLGINLFAVPHRKVTLR